MLDNFTHSSALEAINNVFECHLESDGLYTNSMIDTTDNAKHYSNAWSRSTDKLKNYALVLLNRAKYP